MIACGLLLFGATPALTETIYYPPQVTGKKARRQIRHFLYGKNLVGDKKAVFDRYGFSRNRLRTNAAGRITERWRYYELGLEFTFDKDSNLIDEREIPREDRRAWVYQK